jgi:hypothetical protein
MEEPSQSIWKRAWRGPWATLLWVALLAGATFVIVVAITLASDSEWAGGTVIAASVIAILVVLAAAFLRWVWCWRNLRRLLLGLAGCATLIALAYIEENLRGKWAWNSFRREWEAKGEKFDWASFIPPQVPDEQNFGALPIWTNLFRYEWDPQQKRQVWRGGEFMSSFRLTWSRSDTNHPGDEPSTGDWQQQRRTDLVPWQAYYRATNVSRADAHPIPVVREFPVAPQPQSPAADVLLALSRDEANMKLLREAATRPYVRYPVGYEPRADENVAAILLPHLAKAKLVAQLCRLQAIAALQNGQTDLALDDVRLGLKLADSSGGDAFLISHLVRIVIFQITLEPIWEGLADHKWSDAQLVELEKLLGRIDYLADQQQGMRCERAGAVSIADYLMRQRSFFGRNVFEELWGMENGDEETVSFAKSMPNSVFCAVPRGWFYQNDLTIARLHQELILPIVDERQRIIKPGVVRANDAELSRRLKERSPFNLLARLMLPALGRMAEKSAYGQVSVDLARVACALERHRLANGAYPESLAALAPKYLAEVPHDVINGQPLHYHRTDDGRFVLYSVGWNETDDGGTIVVGTPQRDRRDEDRHTLNRDEGDWVWSYTPVPMTVSPARK